MAVVEEIHELIGHTPMIHLNHLSLPEGADIYAKAELLNPGGSIKDRLGQYMIQKAEESGRLKPGGIMMEITAGNTGIGLALAAINKGYRFLCIVPDCYAKEKQIILSYLGAEVVHVDGDLPAAKKKAESLLQKYPDAWFVNQFENPDNPRTYYETLAPEIEDDMQGNIDYFVSGAGSGGTFSGTARYLKEKNSSVKAVLADPVGSIIGGGKPGHFKIEGIGNDFIAETMDLSLVDKVVKVNDQEAADACRMLAGREGILAGSSSGASLAAVLKMIDSGCRGNFVIILPDRMERYFSEGFFK